MVILSLNTIKEHEMKTYGDGKYKYVPTHS